MLLVMLISCNDLSYKRSKLVLTETTIKQDTIRKKNRERGNVVCNDRYRITSISYFVNEQKSIPDWLKNQYKNNQPIHFCEIDLPFVLFKESGDEYFYVIKNNDTLKFKLVAYK